MPDYDVYSGGTKVGELRDRNLDRTRDPSDPSKPPSILPTLLGMLIWIGIGVGLILVQSVPLAILGVLVIIVAPAYWIFDYRYAYKEHKKYMEEDRLNYP